MCKQIRLCFYSSVLLEGEDRKQVCMWTSQAEDEKALGRGMACSNVLLNSVFKCGTRVGAGGGRGGGMMHCKPLSEISYFILVNGAKGV